MACMERVRVEAGRGGWRVPNRSFTLVEMLVVIAIMSILGALLMPALMAAKRQADAVSCASNQRQCGIILSQYADDYNGSILTYANPLGTYAGHYGWQWAAIMGGYLKAAGSVTGRPVGNTVSSCPYSYKNKVITDILFQSYAGNENAYYEGNQLSSAWKVVATGSGYMHLLNARNISTPSRFVLLTEGLDRWAMTYMNMRIERGVLGGCSLWLRHEQRANALLLDGHVKAMYMEDCLGVFGMAYPVDTKPE